MAKIRVYELAKELDVDSRALLRHLQDQGEFVRSASSTLEPPVVRRVRQNPPRLTRPRKPAPPANSPFKPLGDRPRDRVEYRRSDQRLARPARRPRLNPFASSQGMPRPAVRLSDDKQAKALREAAEFFGVDAAGLRPAPSHKLRRGGPRQQQTPPDDREWFELWITPAERDVWVAAGLRRHDARIAAECIKHALIPADLSVVIVGRSVAQRLIQGQPVAQVAFLLEQHRGAEGITG